MQLRGLPAVCTTICAAHKRGKPVTFAGQQGDLSIADLLKGLGDAKSKMGPARKALQKLAQQEGRLAAPLPGPIRERQERKAGYETTKQDITKWQPLVKVHCRLCGLNASQLDGQQTKAMLNKP